MEKLDHVSERLLTLVVAPMGYGKTSSVYEWVEKSGVQAAWLSLDESDNDPIVFWKYFLAATEKIFPGIGTEAEYTLSSYQLLEENVHVNIIINRIAQHGGRVVLVLDDLHTITGAKVYKGLSHLIRYLPVNAHIIIISRTEPPMELNDFELRSQVLRINANDLRFRQDEIADFYTKRGLMFDTEQIEEIDGYTKGWAAAMVAIAVSAKNSTANKALLTGKTYANSDVYQYLMNSMFGSYPPKKKAFLLKISILEFLQRDICCALTGEDDAANFFEDMRKRNEFLTELGDGSGVYLMHPILKDFLLKKLRRDDPDAYTELNTKAADWYRGRGFLPQAVSHYLNGMRFEEAFQLIEMQLGGLASKNEYETALSWIERLPEQQKQNSIKIAVFYSMYYAQGRSSDLSRKWLAHAKDLLENDILGENGEQIRALVGLTAVNLLLREGNVQELIRLIRSGEIRGSGSFKTIEYMDLNISNIYIYRSPVHVMIKLFEADREAFDKLRDYHGMMSVKRPGFLPLAAAEYYYEKNRPDEALPLFLNAAEFAGQLNYPGVLVPAMAGIYRIKRIRGDTDGALSILEECESRLEAIRKPHWKDLVCALKARCFLETGNIEGAEKWVSHSKLHALSEISRVREFELIVLARVLWAKNKTDDAEMLLMRLLSFAEAENRLHSMVEILNLLSITAFQKGNAGPAFEYLEKSLKVGLDEGFIRSYIDEAAPMLAVLKQAARSFNKKDGIGGELKRFAVSLISLIGEESGILPNGSADSRPDFKKLLTAKELEVLELLCAAYSNEDIGKKLNITQRTVKTHTGNIYSKLGVKTRAQCVKLAYEEGWG